MSRGLGAVQVGILRELAWPWVFPQRRSAVKPIPRIGLIPLVTAEHTHAVAVARRRAAHALEARGLVELGFPLEDSRLHLGARLPLERLLDEPLRLSARQVEVLFRIDVANYMAHYSPRLNGILNKPFEVAQRIRARELERAQREVLQLLQELDGYRRPVGSVSWPHAFAMWRAHWAALDGERIDRPVQGLGIEY